MYFKVISLVLLKRVMRFTLTGIFITTLHFVIAIIFIEHIAPNPSLANGVAFAFATSVSYLINTTWSFSGQLDGKTLIKFLTVSILGFFLSILIAWVFQELGFSYLSGICAVALTIPLITFLLHTFWTYR